MVPIQQGTTTRDGQRVGYYRWGDEGKMYLYEQGNRNARLRAKRLAQRQGRAIEASG
jgi:hypothetical protein